MRSTPWIVCVLAGCGFSTTSQQDVTDGGPDVADGRAIDATPMPDARVCFGTGLGAACLPSPPMIPLELPDTTTFETGVDANCTHVVTIGGVDTCVLAGTVITLPEPSTFRGIGSRPLVIVATDTITIDGTLSVSSTRIDGAGAGAAACPTPAQGEDDSGGGGGGAGGSFLGRGGNGGIGDTNDGNQGLGGIATAAIPAPTTIRGGCRGARGGNATQNGGLGSFGGGAMYLIAATSIEIAGGADAGGGGGSRGGTRGGGGGAGSGGFIGLDAPTVMVTGAVTANGGGGGEGGGFGAGGHGEDGTLTAQRARGGAIEIDGGNGGDGAAGGTMAGSIGGNSDGGGGGGGGGAGFIYVKGALSGAGTISPAAAVTP